MESDWLLLTGGDIVLPGGAVVQGGTLVISDGVVQDILDTPPAAMLLESDHVSVVDATGCWVTPGLIDQHLHGAFGVDFNQSSLDDIHQLLSLLPQYGITGVLPTLMTAPKLDMVVGLSRLEEVVMNPQERMARVFGIHLEGPFLNPAYRGAHPPEDLLPLTDSNLSGLISPSVRRITLAPELDPDGRFVASLAADGLLCSIGHSGADYITAMQAIQSGARCATHLFNAMMPIHHRSPGIATACLLHDELFVEMITDGEHLSPPTVELVLKTKPFDKTILISDCNALTGLQPGSSMNFGKQTVTASAHAATNEEGRLAGSTSLITDCVRNLVAWGILPFPLAVQLATYNPALHLGEAPLFGQISEGAMADLVLWNQDTLAIEGVLLAGEPLALDESLPQPSSPS